MPDPGDGSARPGAAGVAAIAGLALLAGLAGSARLSPAGITWGLGEAISLAVYFLLSAAAGEAVLPPLVMAWGGLCASTVFLAVAGGTGLLRVTVRASDVEVLHRHLSWIVAVAELSLVAAVIAYVAGIASFWYHGGGGEEMFPPPGAQVSLAGGDAAGAGGDRGCGDLGQRAVSADLVADDLRQAVGHDVQVVLVGADAFVERVRGWVVLDQGAAERGERAVGRDGVLADRAAVGVGGVGEAARGGQPARSCRC
jgi:hypothetical protein